MLFKAPKGGFPGSKVSLTLVLILIGTCAALMIGVQLAAEHFGFQGPIHSLISDYIATPKAVSVPWAGFGLALIGLDNRRRAIALVAAIGIDLVFMLERVLRGGVFTFGNGPLIVLTAIAVVAALRWTGAEKASALRGVAFGALLIVASKVAVTWLQISAITRPMVLDEYTQLADHALGNPSWAALQLMDALGPVGQAFIDWIYFELPIAAMLVAFWQLRHVGRNPSAWPTHHLVRTFMVLAIIGPVFYLIFPLVGPVFAFGADGAGFQISDSWPGGQPPFDLTPQPMLFDDFTPRNCMPSMHTAWALALFIHSRSGPWWLRLFGTVWLVGTLVATLGFGYHYGVDLLAGAVLCLTVEAALRDPERGWGWFRTRLVVGGTVLFAAQLLSFRYLPVQLAKYPELGGFLLVGTVAAFVCAFYATFFARPGGTLAAWGGRVEVEREAELAVR